MAYYSCSKSHFIYSTFNKGSQEPVPVTTEISLSGRISAFDRCKDPEGREQNGTGESVK